MYYILNKLAQVRYVTSDERQAIKYYNDVEENEGGAVLRKEVLLKYDARQIDKLRKRYAE